jgi:membrane carboxypeptidase
MKRTIEIYLKECPVDFGRNSVERALKDKDAHRSKLKNLIALTAARVLIMLLFLTAALGAAFAAGALRGIVDSAPELKADSIAPMGFATSVYDADGNLVETLVMAGANRQEATYEELPKNLVNAFVAIEDERFWKHNGVDTRSIMRAVVGVLRGTSSSGGGSTITQQLIKNNLFNGGREKSFGEKLTRKIQEQYLALKLEQMMSKEEILTNYLNTINLGSNALGVKVAARRYFNKEVKDLTLSECTVLAGITQNPSRLNPITGRQANEEKRKVILRYMLRQGYITKEEQEEALADNVYDRIENADLVSKEKATHTYSYFTDELVSQVQQDLKDKFGYTDTQAHNLLYSGGLSIYTTQDPTLQAIVDSEINNPENYAVTKYALEYRLSVKRASGEVQNYSEKDVLAKKGKEFDGLYRTDAEAKADAEAFKASVVNPADDQIIGESMHIILEPQDSFVLMEHSTGKVKALSGGRGEKTVSLSLNRATNSYRQPGSTFKVLAAFAPALDACGQTLGSVYYDGPYEANKKQFRNWYGDDNYLGWSSIRDGIMYSMNIVAVRCLMETVSPQLGAEYSKKFGITSLTDSDYNPAMALGGLTKGVNNLELTAAFAAIANQGVYTKPVFYTKIVDHNGKVLLENSPEQRRVIKDSTAFLLTDALQQSMLPNRKFASSGVNVNTTSTRAKPANMSSAGKSGTTSNNVDVWFVGYTPYYTAGIWAGCDENQPLTDGNGGNSFHKDIWRKIMERIHQDKPDPGFAMPDSIVSAEICRKSGKLPVKGICSRDPRGDAVYTEYFARGTIPTEMCDKHTTMTVCAVTGLLPTTYCPTTTRVVMVVPDSEVETDDSRLTPYQRCNIHTSAASLLPSRGVGGEAIGIPGIKPGDNAADETQSKVQPKKETSAENKKKATKETTAPKKKKKH